MAQQEHNLQNFEGTLIRTPLAPLPEGTGEEKTYHTRYPGSTFITRDGEVVFFNGAGDLITDSLALQFELNKISDKAGSAIFTRAPVITQSDLQPAADQKNTAAEVIRKLQESQSKTVGG